MRKSVGPIASGTVAGPGQARLVEKQFGIVTPVPELDEVIERTRRAKDLPGKKKKRELQLLLALKSRNEPCSIEIRHEAERLRLPASALRSIEAGKLVRAGENRRPSRMRI
ncbi:Uncharacterised protein [Candidatus Burarchaeum australiense]|nr:Uncharacterised protein [Candidatus Burarchaeum australiense]